MVIASGSDNNESLRHSPTNFSQGNLVNRIGVITLLLIAHHKKMYVQVQVCYAKDHTRQMIMIKKNAKITKS